MVKITADSTADLDYLFEEEDINVLPLKITLDGKEYLDGVDITPFQIFDAYKEKKILPKTSTRSIEDYKEFYNLHNGTDGLIHFCISQSMSASYNNAFIASQEFPNIYVVDSMNLSTGIGLLVLKAKDLAKKGLSAKEIFDKISSLIPYVQASFVVDTMEYLHKGGRCNSLTKFVAGALKIKPMIIVKDGKMTVGQKFIGSFSKNIIKYVESVLKTYDNPDYTRIFITHTHCDPKDVNAVETKIKELAPGFKKIIKTYAGCTITSHCGQGTLGILFINKADDKE